MTTTNSGLITTTTQTQSVSSTLLTTIVQAVQSSTTDHTSTTISTSSTLGQLITSDKSIDTSSSSIVDSTSVFSNSSETTTIPAVPGVNDGINMTILISAGAAAGTVLLAVIIVILCICCRCGRKGKKGDQYKTEAESPPPGKRPDPVGAQSTGRKESLQGSELVFKVDDPPDKHRPYHVDGDPRYVTGGASVYSGQGPSSTSSAASSPTHQSSGQFSIPRPSVSSEEQPHRKYHPKELLSESSKQNSASNRTYHEQQNSSYQVQNQSSQKQVDGQAHISPANPVLRAESGRNVGERKYVSRSQQQKSQKGISSDRAKSGKYETKIEPYKGSTYGLSGDFTTIVTPVDTEAEPQHLKQPKPVTVASPEVLPKPNRRASEPKMNLGQRILPPNDTHTEPRSKPQRRVPPEHEKPQGPSEGMNELANNPVFNKRKQLVEKTCKTIRLKDDGSSDGHAVSNADQLFVKDNPETNEDEDPYYKIRESKLNLNMNIIPQGKAQSQVYDIDYEDTVVKDDRDEYVDTVAQPTNQQRHADTHNYGQETTEYVNIPGTAASNSNDHNTTEYVNIPRQEEALTDTARRRLPSMRVSMPPEALSQAVDEWFDDAVQEDQMTDTARRRLPSMRASMHPEALSEAVNQLFDEAIADSEIDLSKVGTAPPPTGNNNQRAPVLKRKTKIEEAKSTSDELKERESWRVSRSSFFDEVGVNDPPHSSDIHVKGDYINVAMMKKGAYLTGHHQVPGHI